MRRMSKIGIYHISNCNILVHKTSIINTKYIFWSEDIAVKRVSIRIEDRSVNNQVLVLIREHIKAFELTNGPIGSDVTPANNVKPARK